MNLTVRLFDLYSFLVALAIHVVLAVGIWKAPAYIKRGPKIVQVDVRHPPLPKVTPRPPPPPPVEPPPTPQVKKVKKAPTPVAQAPVPNREPPKEPPKETPPVFGITEESVTTGDSSFAVNTGNTTIADPNGPRKPQAKVQPLPAAPPAAAPAPVFKPVSALEVKDFPEPDEAACQPPNRLYPEEAREQGIEGDTQLRMEIDSAGKIHGIKILSGPARTLNDIAATWMRSHCHFKPARNTAGQPCPFVITYTVHWQIDR